MLDRTYLIRSLFPEVLAPAQAYMFPIFKYLNCYLKEDKTRSKCVLEVKKDY